MAKMVGYACSIKLQWLNHAVQLLAENLTEAEYKNKMNEDLSFEIDSPTRLRKTREILMNIWVYDSDEITPIRQEALRLLKAFPDYAVPIHLCMIYLTYPVFADVCKYMGRLFEFHDEITNPMLKQKLFDEWGERGTLEATTRRITLTLKEMGILTNEMKTRYVLQKQEVCCEQVINFMLQVAMMVDGNSYYSFMGLRNFDILFPFSFQLNKEQLMTDERFIMTNFDGELSVTLSK